MAKKRQEKAKGKGEAHTHTRTRIYRAKGMDDKEKVEEEHAERRNGQRENWRTEGHGGAGVPRVMVIASEYIPRLPVEELPRVRREEAPAAREGVRGWEASREERVANEKEGRQGDTKKRTGTYLEANVTLL